MNTQVRRAVAATLALSLTAAGLAGCGKKSEAVDNTKTFMSLKDGGEMNTGVANMILRYNQADFERGMGAFIKSYYGDIWNSDITGSGRPYGDTFKEQMVTEMEHILLDEAHAEELGVELTADDEAAISAAAKQFIADNADYGEALEKMSASEETAEAMLRYYTIKAKAEEAMSADVDTEVSDEEAAQRTVSYVAFVASTEAEETEAVTEGAEAVSEAVTEQVADVEEETSVKTSSEDATEGATEAAESVQEEAVTEASTEETETESPEMIAARAETLAKAEAFLAKAKDAKDAEQFDQYGSEVSDGDQKVNASSFTFGDDDTYPDQAVIEATKGLDDNTLVDQVIEVGTTYYVLYVADAFDEEATADKKEEIVEQRKRDAIDAKYDEWAEKAEFTVDDKILAALVFDFALNEETEASTEAVSEAWTEVGTESGTEGLSESTNEMVG